MSWLDDPRLWIPVGGIAAHAILTWYRVGQVERAHELLAKDVDSLREWRAQAREKLGHLERIVERRRAPRGDEESSDEDS